MNTVSPSKDKKDGSAIARKSAARLMGVQALYQMHKNEQNAKQVIPEFLDHRTGVDADGDKMVSPDRDHFSDLVQGVETNFEQLQDMVNKNKAKETQAKEPLLNGILLCGAYELMMRQDIDFPVIISDYVHVTEAFYDQNEAKLVNGILDSLRKTVRSA